MSLRFFADQCVPFLVVRLLRDAGHEVLVLREHLPPSSVDPIVIAKAQKMNAILVSINGDFSDIVTYPPKNFRDIVALQIRNHPETIHLLMDRLIAYCSKHSTIEHYQGKLLLVESHRIRIRL
jgi:predicted nuclease of predicted toxin-antitoxin system